MDVEVLLLMFDQEKFFGMGQQCTTHQIENYLRPTPTLLFHMSSHKKADHTKGDDKWAGAKVILSLNYGLWPFSSAYFHTDVPKREISTHSFQFIRIQGVFKKNVLSVHFWILIHFMPLFNCLKSSLGPVFRVGYFLTLNDYFKDFYWKS